MYKIYLSCPNNKWVERRMISQNENGWLVGWLVVLGKNDGPAAEFSGGIGSLGLLYSLTTQTISKMATSARHIRVAVRGGDIFPCRPEFTVEDAVAGIRAGYGLSGGYIRDQRGMMRGTDVIGDAVGDRLQKQFKMAAREIRVAVRGGEVFPCDPEWDVDKAKAEIRAMYGLEYGAIRDEMKVLDGKVLIKDAVGDLTFVGGRDLPPSQTAPATATAQPAGMSQILTR
jgi:hypothetical protein